MGLLAEVQTMNIKQARKEQEEKRKQEQRQKEIEEIMRKKDQKQQEQEYLKDLKKAVEKDLKNTFENCFEREGLQKAYINLCLKETRDNIIKNVAESSIESEYVDQIYENTLNKVKKIYENDEKAKQALLQMQMQEQIKQQQVKEEKRNIFYNLMNILFLLFNPISLIIILLIAGYFFLASPILK